ncbi:TetR/AcrR family transcriptional regulator, partial [Kineococcus indalonis]|uniref:TetR/AcrR family transcriptional regulator n=1 Tax=Kineococcus indalonis TaxID=2696566 RepID=UPI0014130079
MPTPPPLAPLRERRRAETTAAVARAALELACERPWAGVTVDDVAARSGVSRRTFFNYFPSKDEALLHFAPAWDADLLAAFREGGGPALDALEELLVTHTERAHGHREDARRFFAVVHDNPELLPVLLGRIAAVEEELAAAVRRREPGADELRARVLASCAASVSRVSARCWMDDPDADPVAT